MRIPGTRTLEAVPLLSPVCALIFLQIASMPATWHLGFFVVLATEMEQLMSGQIWHVRSRQRVMIKLMSQHFQAFREYVFFFFLMKKSHSSGEV